MTLLNNTKQMLQLLIWSSILAVAMQVIALETTNTYFKTTNEAFKTTNKSVCCSLTWLQLSRIICCTGSQFKMTEQSFLCTWQ